MGGNGTSPCASCKLLRRRCAKDCIFAPYFPSDDPHKFAIVHKVFGASNVSKILVYEATARLRDPVYGCVGAISYLQDQVSQLQMQLAVAQAEILCIQMHQDQPAAVSNDPPIDLISDQTTTTHQQQQQQYYNNFNPNSSDHVYQDSYSFKRESFFGHDMVS
ncbi:hypothetical protein V2J09_012542 [Rumex salicifolius]